MPTMIVQSRSGGAGASALPGWTLLPSPIPGSTSFSGPKNDAKSAASCWYSLVGPSAM